MSTFRRLKFALPSLLVVLLLTSVLPARAQRKKPETIDARATGTSTQMGKNVSVQVTINSYSTEQDRQVLVDAFTKGESKGLVIALSKMKPVGRIAITGTVGYDLAYIAVVRTPTGRRVRFVTNRPLKVREAYVDGRSTDHDLIAGEININDSDKDKSAGTLFPAAKLKVNKEGQLQFDLLQNPWTLVNIIDWNGPSAK
jgi:hypothetical protein